MATIPEALALAAQHHQAGQFQTAEQICQQILAVDPDHVDALHLLGLTASRLGRHEDAALHISRAIALRGTDAAFHSNLGAVLKDLGRLDKAVACCRRALELKPDHVAAHYNLGNAFVAQGKLGEAVACFRRAIELKPDYAVAHNNLGTAFLAQWNLDEAVACFRRSIELQPDFPPAHANLGNAFTAQRKLDGAIACYRRALELNPADAATLSYLGNALRALGRLEEAVDAYHAALELKPESAEAHTDLGHAFLDQGKLEEALGAYSRAVELQPDYAEARSNRSLLMLQRGDFERGWSEYQWRWKCKEFRSGALKGAPLDASTIGRTKTVMLHTDQGFGDTLQFIRYAPLVKQRAGEVWLRCSKNLIPLLSRCAGIDKFIPHEARLPARDAEAYLTGLPLAFHTTLKTVPQEVPYLFADPELVEHWRPHLPSGDFRVGIAWQGNPDFKHDKSRSVPLLEFNPLAQVEGVRLISLQKVHGLDQLAGVKDKFPVIELALDRDESTGAFMDTAAVIKNLDLVITSDTSIAHLAGGLGVPVWVALSFIPEWRWLLNRSDSPWYPTMRLFRQTSAGNWKGVFERMKAELTDLVLQRRIA